MTNPHRFPLGTKSARARAWANALFIDHAIFRLAWTNLAPVIPGRIWRSNHPTPARLHALKARLGLRTVINLRGPANNGSDALSRAAAARLGLDFIDLPMKSKRAPTRESILDLHHLWQTMQTPALLHCKSGADRAGLVSGIFILFAGGTPADALTQLSLRFGHFAGADTGILGHFFRAFRDQAAPGQSFLDWATNDYDPAALTRSFAAIPHTQLQALQQASAKFLTNTLLRRE